MKSKLKKIFIISIFFYGITLYPQEIISSGDLTITVAKLEQGAELTSIKSGNIELLDTEMIGTLFTVKIDDLFLTSLNGWGNVDISSTGANGKIVLSNPTNSALSDSLRITINIITDDTKSDWDISVTGLGNNSLLEMSFPYINIKTEGDDYFFLPRYSGKLIKNPKANGIDYTLNYVRGWSATMQYTAYYNDSYGIYLGTHDPKATKKDFIIKANIKNGVKYQNIIPVPNKTLPGNDYDYSGVFRFQIFKGDWYDAALIYKKWVSAEAEYWPEDSEARNSRLNAMGSIGAWFLPWGEGFTTNTQRYYEQLRNALGVPIGLHWYLWYKDKAFDQAYPYLLPEKDGMTEVVHNLQANNDIFIVPYTNGRIFDMSLSQYKDVGKPGAVKNVDGSVRQDVPFAGRQWATMCPTYKPYQDVLLDHSKQLMNRIGTAGIYFDMVTAAGAIECYDTTHNHTLGGGSFWRDGYKELFDKVHSEISDSKFITSEGACDYLADVVDGFLTLGWMTDNMVPAFQVVYGGKLLLFTVHAGYDYGDPALYCKQVSSFINGIQPGHFNSYLLFSEDTNEKKYGAPFLKRVAGMRYKLKDFMSLGQMLRPVFIDKSNIPTITTDWYDHGYGNSHVTLSYLQHSSWKNKDGNRIAVVFANLSMNKEINFNFDFNGSENGIEGGLKVQQIYGDRNSEEPTFEKNSFSKTLTLAPLDITTFIIQSDTLSVGVENKNIPKVYSLKQNYPNPFNPTTVISFTLPKAGNTKVEIYNLLGQKVATLVNEELSAGLHKYKFNAQGFSSGIYLYRLSSGNYVDIKKMLLLK